MTEDFTIFAGTAHPDLAAALARELGVELGACKVERFPDGELSVRLDEEVQGREIFVLQPTSPPVNEHLIELLAFADACRRAAAKAVTAIVPYFGYARADKRGQKRTSIMASAVAELLENAGITRIVAVDIHTPQVEGFFRIPFDNLSARDTLIEALRKSVTEETVVVSPDAGRIEMATEFALALGTPVAMLHKERLSARQTKVMQLVGEVRGRACLIVDDMISTGGTLCTGIEALQDAGAQSNFTVAATHGLFVNGARERLMRHGVREIFVTDTIQMHERDWPQLRVVSIAPLLAKAVRKSLSLPDSMTDDDK